MKKLAVIIGLICIFAFVCVGCAPKTEDKDRAAITAVLQETFTGPDKELNAALADPGDPKSVKSILEERYGDYFTEKGLDSFWGSYALGHASTASRGGFQMEANKIEIRASQSGYDFTVTVSYSKEGQEKKTANVTGNAQCSAESKISSLRFFDDESMLKNMS